MKKEPKISTYVRFAERPLSAKTVLEFISLDATEYKIFPGNEAAFLEWQESLRAAEAAKVVEARAARQEISARKRAQIQKPSRAFTGAT